MLTGCGAEQDVLYLLIVNMPSEEELKQVAQGEEQMREAERAQEQERHQ